MALFHELQRRGVIRAALAYLAAAWLLIQIADTVFPVYELPDQVLGTLISILAVAFVPTLAIAWYFDLTPDGLAHEQGSAAQSASEKKVRYLDRVIVAMLSLAVAFFAVDKFVFDPQRDSVLVEEATNVGRISALLESRGETSIAVLPFDFEGDDPEQAYLSTGIAEEILNRLTKVAALRVISRNSAFSFRDQDLSIADIAERLRVSNVLHGSMRRIGDRLRVSIELVDTDTDSRLWSSSYTRTLKEIFTIEDDIASNTISALKMHWQIEQNTNQIIDPEAQALYLRARHISVDADLENLAAAERLLERAIEIEPEFVKAHSELGRIYSIYENQLPDSGVRATYTKKIRGVEAILTEIAPDSADAYTWRLYGLGTQIGPDRAAKIHERAINAHPTNPQLLSYSAHFFSTYGRPDVAVRLAEFALRRDPLCAFCLADLGKHYRTAGRYEDAVDAIRTGIKWSPENPRNNWALGSALLFAGQSEEALKLFEDPRSPEERLGRVIALYETGRQQEFEVEFGQLRSKIDYPEGIARIYAWTGDFDAAIEQLRITAEKEGPDYLGVIYYGGWYRELMQEPKFDEFLLSIGRSPGFPPQMTYEVSLPEIILAETR